MTYEQNSLALLLSFNHYYIGSPQSYNNNIFMMSTFCSYGKRFWLQKSWKKILLVVSYCLAVNHTKMGRYCTKNANIVLEDFLRRGFGKQHTFESSNYPHYL